MEVHKGIEEFEVLDAPNVQDFEVADVEPEQEFRPSSWPWACRVVWLQLHAGNLRSALWLQFQSHQHLIMVKWFWLQPRALFRV